MSAQTRRCAYYNNHCFALLGQEEHNRREGDFLFHGAVHTFVKVETGQYLFPFQRQGNGQPA